MAEPIRDERGRFTTEERELRKLERSQTFERAEDFIRSLEEIASGLAPSEVRIVQKKVALQVLSGVVRRTPVDEGRARGGWQLTIGDTSPREGGESRDEGSIITSALEQLAGLSDYGVVFITNNVPYILVLDQGGFVPQNPGPSKDPRPGRLGRILVQDGYSVQAPNGMVDATLASLSEQFNA